MNRFEVSFDLLEGRSRASNGVLKENLMNNWNVLFHQTPQQLRRAGARGGKATARNRRARLSAASTTPTNAQAPPLSNGETTADAIAVLDIQFPWLRGVEKRFRADRKSAGDGAEHRLLPLPDPACCAVPSAFQAAVINYAYDFVILSRRQAE